MHFNRHPELALTLLTTALLLSGCGGERSGDIASKPTSTAVNSELSITAVNSEPSSTTVNNDWSNPATWGGTVPSANTAVEIPAGKTVVLDTKVKVKSLMVKGTLVCGGTDIAIEADWAMVVGAQSKLSCGTKAQPYMGKFDMTLSGPQTDDIMGMGARVLGAMDGGTVEMFGEPRAGWTKLNATALKGSTTLTLADSPKNWRAGMDIVIGSSSEDPHEAEVRRILSISGTSITLNAALTYDHFGLQQSYNNGSKTFTADTRAAVGLLSRNITLRGGGDSQATQFGAHMMTMAGAKAYVSDIGFNRVGQKSRLGRYPFHWHLAGDVRGQFISNSSIWESYNRCVTVHGTDNTVVEGNVCYDHLGHGYFLEDGTEQGNTIQNNLGVLTVRPKPGEGVLESDSKIDAASIGPATFWISNPNNTVVGNHAVGSDGSGFWYNLDDRLISRIGGTAVNPRVSHFERFENNTASSMLLGFSTCQGGGEKGMETPNEPTWTNLTVFQTRNTAVWPCGLRRQTFNNLRVLDVGGIGQGAALTAPTPMLVEESLFVANSAMSAIGNRTKVGRVAIGFYDQGFNIKNTHFVGYTKTDASSWMAHGGGAVKKTWNYVEGVTFSPAKFAAFFDDAGGAGGIDVNVGAVVFDIDGSLGAGPNMTLVTTAPIHAGLDCANSGRIEAGSFGILCKTRIIRTRIDGGVPFIGASYTMFRTGPNGEVTQHFSPAHPAFNFFQAFSAPNQPYHYGAQFETDPGTDFGILFGGYWPNDTMRYELRGMRANASVSSANFSQVGTATEFDSASGSVWFRSGDRLHIKFTAPATIPQWQGVSWVQIVNK
ncbi:G8 domain-containing protein [Actimicrobium sp. CCC2.4]|uniref:G8 domain-containing protein n=1 Tax=Actimicrobium sp. CCC2.4 TaxID=3048606 RepID=UPI002AC9507F|nr:G8 domain-containing protein [Actimicrobium sp. CCC2.4]MEB0136532.1 G8 domain-containing protein [Actimicrobium sp. CCC2.4]WPX30891.1 G8 domain-containing protein [Actimicrobium sp. CCC2.4]